jgi:hypothetical protein
MLNFKPLLQLYHKKINFWLWNKTAYMTMKSYRRLFNKCRSLCHTDNLNDSHNNIKWSTIISLRFHYFLTQSHSTLRRLFHFVKVLQFSWQKLGSCILLAAQLVTSQLLCHWHKNNSPVGKVSTICWIYLKFPVTWMQQLPLFAVHCMGLHCHAQGSYLMTDVHASAS